MARRREGRRQSEAEKIHTVIQRFKPEPAGTARAAYAVARSRYFHSIARGLGSARFDQSAITGEILGCRIGCAAHHTTGWRCLLT